jgi:hypothetical protein
VSNQWCEEQNRCQREIDQHQEADKSYMAEGVQLLELVRNAQRLFVQQEPREKRHMLNFVLSNCTWEDGEVTTGAAHEPPHCAAQAEAQNSLSRPVFLQTFRLRKFTTVLPKSLIVNCFSPRQPPHLSLDISGQREQPESNERIDHSNVFSTLSMAPMSREWSGCQPLPRALLSNLPARRASLCAARLLSG